MADCSTAAGIHLIVAQQFVTKNTDSPCVSLCFHLNSAIDPLHRKIQSLCRLCWIPQKRALPAVHMSRLPPPPWLPLKLHAVILVQCALIVLAAIVLGMRIFVGEASVVPTASMEGTILVGDHLFMDKLLYGPEIPLVHWRLPALKTIRRGDIIVFRYPKDISETFLKRVTALGGDRLEIKNGVLYVNSQPVHEPYAVHHAPVHNPLESWGPTVVPEGKLFVMGDNRDNSSDSRDWGFVPKSNVIGEPLFVYWSYDAPTARWLDENPGHRISFYASIAENFFSNTRWNRTGMLL
jgi:signal peptidase I